jgi:predicted Holliday junction resolvase-like endonuclease
MDLLTFILIVFFLCVLIFLIYFFIKGAKGDLSLARPVESRVDEYLDRRFQNMVEEWQLVSHPKLQQFKEQHYKEIENNEARLSELKKYESGMQTTLVHLEARLDTVEKELAEKGTAKK